jgi:carbamoyl-phosphate synthase large subunit
MRSTGEAIGIGIDFGEAFAKATIATGTQLPRHGRVFVAVNDYDKETILPIVQELVEISASSSPQREGRRRSSLNTVCSPK